ncbi:MAG: hypothetical protein EPO26_13280 [Chloroflexota bacterium]|nr:MAG: hypothetical protein EPO26_13280 [Chloroflexota bacterium]
MVESLTIILASGLTRGWRSSLLGAASAIAVLALLIAVLGVALVDVISLSTLQLVIGVFLLIFGLQWLRKAILRFAGLKAVHDEDAILREEMAQLRAAGAVAREGIDWPGFVVSFKGALLEGLEVAFIVITFGANADPADSVLGLSGIPLAAAAAGLALFLVALAGVLLHRPLAQVPENSMKFTVGLMLSAFGTFWAAEGIGVEWPGGDWWIVGLIAIYGVASWAMVTTLRSQSIRRASEVVRA